MHGNDGEDGEVIPRLVGLREDAGAQLIDLAVQPAAFGIRLLMGGCAVAQVARGVPCTRRLLAKSVGIEAGVEIGTGEGSPYRWRVRIVVLLAFIAFAVVLFWPR